MHTLNPINSLLTLAILGVAALAIMTSPLQRQRGASLERSAVKATNAPTVTVTASQEHYAGAWQTLKSKSESQIRKNDERIRTFKAQRARASRTFHATYDRRVAELQRRNIALKGKLVDYKGDRRETRAEFK